MTAPPKPLSREEWEHGQPVNVGAVAWNDRVEVTLDALYDRVAKLERYRERTHGMRHKNGWDSDIIAREEGIE